MQTIVAHTPWAAHHEMCRFPDIFAVQAREILERIRGTPDIGVEFDDIKMAADIANSVRYLLVQKFFVPAPVSINEVWKLNVRKLVFKVSESASVAMMRVPRSRAYTCAYLLE